MTSDLLKVLSSVFSGDSLVEARKKKKKDIIGSFGRKERFSSHAGIPPVKKGIVSKEKVGKKREYPKSSRAPFGEKEPKLPGSLAYEAEIDFCRGLRKRLYERFATMGREKSGKHDPVGYVLERFYKAIPDFDKSIVTKEPRLNGWTISGSWPVRGKQIFDWEIDTWGESGGDVIIKINLFSGKGQPLGIVYRTTVATVDKLVPKFFRWFEEQKAEIKKGVTEEKRIWAELLFEEMTPYQKAQQARRQTVAAHTPRPAKQSVFYKHAVRAIFKKLRKDGESFKGSAKGGQLISQYMLKKYGYAQGQPRGGSFSLTSKGLGRNMKHAKEPKALRAKKEKAYDYIMGIQRRAKEKQTQMKTKAASAG
jgi:hypothetical protein